MTTVHDGCESSTSWQRQRTHRGLWPSGPDVLSRDRLVRLRDLTVMSKEQMDALVHPRFHSNSKPVACFGGNRVFLEGPRCLRLELCGVKLVHPFYVVEYPSPIMIGFDAISAARLVIDAHQSVAYSHFNFVGH